MFNIKIAALTDKSYNSKILFLKKEGAIHLFLNEINSNIYIVYNINEK